MEKKSSLKNNSRRRFLIQTPIAALGLMVCLHRKSESSTLQIGNYRRRINADTCTCCGSCAETCPTDAILQNGDVYAINQNLCFGCGACENECPADAIELGTLIVVPSVDTDSCIACEACVAECPTGALTVNEVAVINSSLCSGCRDCVPVCPSAAIS